MGRKNTSRLMHRSLVPFRVRNRRLFQASNQHAFNSRRERMRGLRGSGSRNAELGPPERISSPEEENGLLCVAFSSSEIHMGVQHGAIGLLKPRQMLDNAFSFVLAGPPGIYAIDLVSWSSLAMTNTLGSIAFTDLEANVSQQKFYRAAGPQ